MVVEKTSAIKHLELQLKTATIEADAKSAHLESLLQENREVGQFTVSDQHGLPHLMWCCSLNESTLKPGSSADSWKRTSIIWS